MTTKAPTKDFSNLSDDQIDSWIEKYVIDGLTADPQCQLLLEERARRQRVLKIERSLELLTWHARSKTFTTYGDLAKAGGVTWNQIHYLLEVCHVRGLPLLTALCVNQPGVWMGQLSPSALDRFIREAQRLGYEVTDGEQFLRKCQRECFEWGKNALGRLPDLSVLSAAPALTIFSLIIRERSGSDRVLKRSTSDLWVPIYSLIIRGRSGPDGVLIRSISDLWVDIVRSLGDDWAKAYQLEPEQWEELIAGAFKKAGYDEVTLTPRSGDHGRDVIAIKHGVGCVKIIGSVKAYKPGRLVEYDAIRALIGVMNGERDVSKGIITTTSDFPPRVGEDPFIKPLMPTRLELINGKNLQKWLTELNASRGT